MKLLSIRCTFKYKQHLTLKYKRLIEEEYVRVGLSYLFIIKHMELLHLFPLLIVERE